MANTSTASQVIPLDGWLQRGLPRLGTLVISALAAMEPMRAATVESFNPVRQGVVLFLLLALHLLFYPWLLITREVLLYAAFSAYMWVSLIWAPSVADGLNTLVPALNFLLVMLLFGSLVTFHNLRSVLTGLVAGFLMGAVIYTKTAGFPFIFPLDMSYNAIAGMYLFGLFITLVFAWYTHKKVLPLVIGLLALIHIAATTSIKTNLGIALGSGGAALMYGRSFLGMLRRNIIALGLLGALMTYAIAGNGALRERVESGLSRVSRGVEILQTRDVRSGTSFGERTEWQGQGIKGWRRSPLFGNGVEAFRTDHGITSHSTPIDLLYNFGVIGCALFYAVFASIALRLISVPRMSLGSLPALIFAGLICYAFITLSGTMHYNAFLAIYIVVSVGLLRRMDPRTTELTVVLP